MIREIKDKTRLQITNKGYEQNIDIEVDENIMVINCGSEEISLSLDESQFLIDKLKEMLASGYEQRK